MLRSPSLLYLRPSVCLMGLKAAAATKCHYNFINFSLETIHFTGFVLPFFFCRREASFISNIARASNENPHTHASNMTQQWTVETNMLLGAGEGYFPGDWDRMLSRILNGCLMWSWTSAKKPFSPSSNNARATPPEKSVHEPSGRNKHSGGVETESEELNEFSIMHLNGIWEEWKGEKYTQQEAESTRKRKEKPTTKEHEMR